MKSSDLLAEWEFDAEAPPSVVASAKDGDLRIELLAEMNRDRRVVFRSQTDDGCWTLSNGTPFFLPRYNGSAYKLSALGLREAVAKAQSRSHFCRVLYWRYEQAVWRVSVSSAGIGLCQVSIPDEMTSAATPFAVAINTWNLTSGETRGWLENQRRIHDSPFAFALDFHMMLREKKLGHVFGFGKNEGKYYLRNEELEKLMRLVLWSRAELWNENRKLGWRIGARQGFQTAEERNSGGWDNELEASHLEKWASVLRRFGPLQPHLNSVTLEYFWNGVEHLAQVWAETPTMHEQLEARMELRDWAREHLPVDVYDEMERLSS